MISFFKFLSTVTFKTVISATVLALLCCCVLCNFVSCSSVQGSEKQHKSDNVAYEVDQDAEDARDKLLSAINNNEVLYDDLAKSELSSRENLSLPKTSCNIFYMVVSTIDGKVSALDLHKQGSLAWSIEADSRPLFSSSLAQMEIVRNGRKIRLIPSLDGAIYQFDGEKVEAIPMSADSLLSSTYRLGDDSMIVGSKDIRNYGINMKTGQIQFTCGSDGCSGQGDAQNSDLNGNDVVIVSRNTQIVRSVDIKNGNEKWNFSVGEHKLSVPPITPLSQIEDEDDNKDDSIPFFTTPKEECPNKEKDADEIDYESLLQLFVPEGRVVALDKKHSRKVAWEHKFGSPIAKAWLLSNGRLVPMNLFDAKHVPTLNAFTTDDLESESFSQPLLYIGSHNKLLYIQPSPHMEAILRTFPAQRIGHVFDPKIKVSWRPYLNTASARTPVFGGNRQNLMHDLKTEESDTKDEDTSLTVWHEDYPFDTGYFLYPEFRDSRSTKKGNLLLIEDLRQSSEPDSFIESLPASMWYYWKEILAFSFVVSLVVHGVLSVFLTPSLVLPVVVNCEGTPEPANVDKSNNHDLNLNMDNVQTPCDKYVSRFAEDFDCLHRLGKGGFGIVFEAVNKLDGQHYAVKRIMLPKSDGAKEKVLREVKALAQLEHPGIVRYFNAWEESPPAGWQKQWDLNKGLCDDTQETLFTSTKSQTAEKVKINQKIHPIRTPTQDLELETCTDTDSIVFLPETSENEKIQSKLKESGSGSFSVHSESSLGSSWSQDFSKQSEQNILFVPLEKSLSLLDDDDRSGSTSSIPFSNYTTNSSKRIGHSDMDLTGDSVVFEASSPTSSRGILIHRDNIHSPQHSVEFTLSTKDDENDEKDDHEQGQTSVPGNAFFVYIQTQLYQKETLKEWLSSNTLNRDRQGILEIFDQIICAVDYVHGQDLMHRDLKPSNIFFSADGTVKVGDFGLATALSVQHDNNSFVEDEHSHLSGRHTADVGTTLYMSPEQKARKPYDFKVDIFALGLIFLELWVPFSTQMERIRTLQDSKRQPQILPSRFIKELPVECELVRQMTSQEPSLRPSTNEILSHDLLQEVSPYRINLHKRARTISDNSNS